MDRHLAPQARTHRSHQAFKKPAAAGTVRLWRIAGLGMLALPSASLAASMSSPSAAGGLVQVIFGLIAVLALLLVSAWLLKRYGGRLPGAGGGGGGAALRVLGGVSLGARERAVLLQVGDKQLLVGVAPGRVQTLCVLDAPVIPPGPAEHHSVLAPGGFAERLAAMLRGGGRAP